MTVPAVGVWSRWSKVTATVLETQRASLCAASFPTFVPDGPASRDIAGELGPAVEALRCRPGGLSGDVWPVRTLASTWSAA